MPLWGAAFRRVRYLGRVSRFNRELDKEIRFHIECRAEELEREGLPASEALAKARREFGSTLRALEETRSVWEFRALGQLTSDLRYTLRTLRREPGFAATAILCLALATGVNTTIFSIAMEVLFSEPSCRDPQTLARVQIGGGAFCPAPQYRFLRDSKVFEDVASMDIGTVANWRGPDGWRRLAGTRVTTNFFEVTGIPVAIGRAMRRNEDDVAVLAYGFWQRTFGGNPAVVGSKLVLDNRPYTVIGILPRNHRNLAGFGFTPDLYLPTDTLTAMLYARLPENMSRRAARDRLAMVCRDLDRMLPDANRRWVSRAAVSGVDGVDRLRAESDLIPGGLTVIVAFFGLLAAGTGLVLLIACANVSSLLLARALARSREIAIRLSLGGSRGRIVRQLLTEASVLGLAGTAAGVVLNLSLSKWLSGARLPVRWVEFQIEPDARLLAYSTAVALFVTLASGLVPSMKATATAVRRQRSRFRNGLVAGQIAVSMVLLTAGLLFVRNLLSADSWDPGFDTRHTVRASFTLLPDANVTPERFAAVVDVAVGRLRALAGVKTADVARAIPAGMPFTQAGELRADTGRTVRLEYNFNAVGPDYFRAVRIPIVRGRPFLESDRTGAPPVVILNEELARVLFGAADPSGHAVRLPAGGEARVAGVARNSRYCLLGEQTRFALYKPYAQYRDDMEFAHLVAETGPAPESVVREVRRTLERVHPAAVVEAQTMRETFDFALIPSRAAAAVLGATALLGITLAAIGLYGLLLYTVSWRTSEIGLRIALGAAPAQILRLVARESMRLVLKGLGIGLALAFFAVRPLAVFLIPGVRPADPVNFISVAGALCIVATLATIQPVLRAIAVAPAVCLRHD